MKTKQLLLLSALLFAVASFSQPVCGFDGVHSARMQNDPLYKKSVEATEKNIQQYIAKHKATLSARTTGTGTVYYTIPVVVHVLHTGGAVGSTYNPTDAQIQGAINYLNQVYNGTYPGTQGVGDLQVQFALAVRDPYCNTTSGIERINASSVSGYSTGGVSTNPGTTPGVDELSIKNLSRWDTYSYYNIWVVNKIDGKDGTAGSFTAGYAYFPGSSPAYDGTIMLATQMASGRKTLPHEIGHAFGLYHVFEGSANSTTCPANTDCSSNGDRVCDTDPITYNQSGGIIDFSCRSGVNTCTGTSYSNNTEANYMNYTTCYNLFTAGQKARILAYAGSALRKSLSTSIALTPTYPITSYSNPVAASCSPVTSADGLSANYAGILNIELNNRNLSSSTARNDNGYVNGTASCLNLIQLTRGGTYSFAATVLGANTEQLAAWIDYNNDGIFDNATEQIHFNGNIPKGSGATSGNFTIPSSATLNTVLRMRVIDEVSTLYGAGAIADGCFNPELGQAEDYPVIISAGTLPVTLVNFEGMLKNNAVLLSWKTAFEQELRNFDIEKSVEGAPFQKIGTVKAAGWSTSPQVYSFTDGHVSETNYYRLRLTNMNGSSSFSPAISIRAGRLRQNVRVVNNPFHSDLELGFSNAGSQVKLQLISTTGILLAEKSLTSVQGQIRWNLPANLSKGTYLVKAVADGELFTYKVVKQ